MSAHRARLAAAVLVAAGALGPLGATPGGAEPAGTAGLDRLQVVESLGVAAVMGVITRVPAESPGGGAYTETHITPDKALGRAAGGYPGPLGEAFLGTSAEQYRNPSMVVAQQPPGLFPAEAQVDGGRSGPQGNMAVIRAKAVSRAEVEAQVIMGSGPSNGPFVVEGGSSLSRSRVEPDGTVVTEAHTTFGRAVVADVLELVGGASRALARTPADGTPTLQFESTMGRIAVNGVGATMTDKGLALADQQAASPADVARFNDGVAQLRQAGITIEAVPAQSDEAAGSGRISGAAALFRYQLPSSPIPNSIGNDETFLLAQVSVTAVALPHPAAELPAAPEVTGPSLDPPETAAPGPSAAAGVAPLSPLAPLAPLPPLALSQLPAPLRTAAEVPVASPGVAADRSASAGRAAPASVTAAASAEPPAPAGVAPFASGPLLATSSNPSLVANVTAFYAVLLFLGAAALLILLGLHKARAT